MNVLVCVKRVPATAGHIALSADSQEIDTRFLGFTVSPHEECAVEEAVRLVEAHGGTSTVLTLGPDEAAEQLRAALAVGVDRAILLATDGREWDPQATAGAIVDAVRAERARDAPPDLLMFGNEAADSGDYQVPVRVAHALDLPCLTGVKQMEARDGSAELRREARGGWEVFELSLPAVISVKEGINLPRFPSVPGRIRARQKPLERTTPRWPGDALRKVRLGLPPGSRKTVEVLGTGPAAAPRAAEILRELGVVPR